MKSIRRNITFAGTKAKKSNGILILDDDTHYLDLMAAALAPFQKEFEILKASCVKEALVKAASCPIRVFIFDVHLPDGTGLDFYNSIRGDHPRARTVVVTGTTIITDESFTKRFGIDALLRKPFKLAFLRETVTELLAAAVEEPQGQEDGPSASGTSFQGTLRSLTITDIVQLKCIGAATSMLELETAQGEIGKVYVVGGELVHAETGELSGVGALNRIVTWSGGKVSEHLVEEEVDRTIRGSWEVLLMEALRLKDESESESAADS